jgi:hypothetical protein
LGEGRIKAQLIPELPSTMEDVLKLVLRSKSMQGFTEAVSQPEYPGFRGLSSNTCLQVFFDRLVCAQRRYSRGFR